MNKVNTIECAHCDAQILKDGGCKVLIATSRIDATRELGICINCLRELNALMAVRLRELRNSGISIQPLTGVK